MIVRSLTTAPADPAAFISEAEAITNRRDRHALEEIFAPTATWTVLIDGLRFAAIGHRDIQLRWAELCNFMDRRRMTVDKHVIAHDAQTIVSGWSGRCPDGMAATGHEVWRFDRHGKVAESTLAGFLNPADADSVLATVRYLCANPRNGLAFAAARLTTSRRDHVHQSL